MAPYGWRWEDRAMRSLRSAAPVTGDQVEFAAVPVTIVIAGVVAVLAALSSRYGFHRDELYFLAAGAHPAWGYVDQPPLTPLVARAATAVFGSTPAGLRVASTLACAMTLFVVALVARELGGGRRAQVFAVLATAASGFALAVGHMVSTATFDLLAWVVISWLALRLLRTGDGRWWLALGGAAGVATLNKYLVGLLAVALLAGVLITGPRDVLRSRWLAGGVVIAAVVAGPNLWWQATHGWPQLTVAGGISSDDGLENRVLFVPMQIAYLSPLFVPVWIAGIRHVWRGVRWARPVVLAYPVLCVLVVASGGKPYYALPLLLVLTAAGCEPLARWTHGAGRVATVAVGGVVAAAMSALITLPVLPADSLSVVNGINPEQSEQIGWPAFTSAVAARWSAIPSRSRAVILAENYGEAGALARYGPEHGLPAPYSGHMSDADWGPPPDSATGPVLVVHQSAEVGPYLSGCHEVGRVNTGRNVDNQEQGAHITLCAGTTEPWSAVWPHLRHYY
jgi:4-amino-4-deoxy-L-arabinose transferase-like glycosyltransferase